MGRSIPDGMRLTALGEITVRSRGYMKWLHEQAARGDIAIVPRGTKMELHHFSSQLRGNDALVIPLTKSNHAYIEENPAKAADYLEEWFDWACHAFTEFLLREASADDRRLTHEQLTATLLHSRIEEPSIVKRFTAIFKPSLDLIDDEMRIA